MKWMIHKKYLWLPVGATGEHTPITLLANDQSFFQMKLLTKCSEYPFYTCVDVSEWAWQELRISGDVSTTWLNLVRFSDEQPEYPLLSPRPVLHYTPKFGWINDPNGLIYHQGVYHLYYQYNPYGVCWENMHWGHATSTDLFHWEEQSVALSPDEHGTMFSGSAIQDHENCLGKGSDAIWYYYTAAGERQYPDNRVNTPYFTQRFAYSVDGGKTLIKSPEFMMDMIQPDNRDPKVFYHEPSQGYIMPLFLSDYDFAVFRSDDLLHWKETQRITVEGMWECPDLVELKIDGDSENTKWMFWSADGYYVIGSFDGYTFTKESERLCAYAAPVPYAAQTYSGVKDRVISVSFLRLKNNGNPYTNLIAIPVTLSLTTTRQGLRLSLTPVEELEQLRAPMYHATDVNQFELTSSEAPTELCICFAQADSGQARLELLGDLLHIDFATGMISYRESEFQFDLQESLDLRVIVDYGVTELFAQKDTVYFVSENELQQLAGMMRLSSDVTMIEGDCYSLQI